MTYKAMIYLIMVIHFLWIILLVGGSIYIFYNPGYVQWHLTIITLTLLLNLFLGACPLTIWEENAREKAGDKIDYHGSFAATYINRIFGIEVTENQVLILMSLIKLISYLIAVGVVVFK